ncbi:MBL fold metallo-hydrolase [Candidatus Saccharibacteria bacterium]|nr:MBL fold metallo-hydrolase [Candidatus Saccharibacteria bacterium]
MEIQYYGANSIKVTTKKSVISIDPQSDIAELKTDLKKTNTVLATQPAFAKGISDELFLVTSPGEYEFEDYSVKGIAAQPHTGSVGDMSATMYRVSSGDISILFVGHIDSKLTEEQLEAIGMVDIVVVPVGGSGYTLDAVGAASVIRAVEPKVVIPVHSSDDGLAYSVPQAATELFVKELGAVVSEDVTDKFKVKLLPEQLTIQLLTKS